MYNPFLPDKPAAASTGPLTLATVGTVSAAGVTLILPGASEPTQAHYPNFSSSSLASGDSVIIARVSGTWVVIGKAGGGGGGGGGGLPTGGATGMIPVKASSANYDIAWKYPRYNRRNLLDNWCFVPIGNLPINQRGQSQYSTAGTFVFDRWKLVSGTARLSESGLILNGTIRQTIEETVDQQYTASMLTNSDVTFLSSFDPSTKVFTLTNNNSVPIKAVKLELGSYQTLAHNEGTESSPNWVLNEIPDYGEELAKCQRYLFIVTSSSASGPVGSGYCPADGQSATFFIPLPVTMRANSIPTFDGTLYIYAPGAAGKAVVSLGGSAYTCGNGLIFSAQVGSGTTLSRGGGYVLRVDGNSKLIFSAES